MQLKKSIFLVYPILLTILLVSCSPPKALEYRDFKNFTIGKLGFTSSSVRMDMLYYNPNNYGLQLKSTDMDIYLNEVYMGRTSQEYQVTIPRRQEFTIPIQMDVDMKNLFRNGLNALLKNEVMVKITGTVKVGKANVFISFPVNYQGLQTFTFSNSRN